MNKIYFIFTFLLLTSIAFSQNYTEYNTIRQDAINLYDNGQYYDAFKKFKLLDEPSIKKPSTNDVAIWKDSCISALENLYSQVLQQRIISDSLRNTVERSVFDIAATKSNSKDYFGTWNFLEIDTLDLSYSNLTYLPQDVQNCQKLKSINLVGNSNLQVDSAFTVLLSLPLVTDIKISVDSISQIPQQYYPWITGIKVNKTGLNKFPTEYLQFPNLKYLDVSGTIDNPNNFADLPQDLFQKTKLQTLILEYCNLSAIPAEIGNLQNLATLKLSGNNLSTMPQEFTNLKKLKVLGIENNKFDDLPDAVCKISSIEVLSCYNNNLTSLPAEIKHLTNIKALYLWDNKIQKIPDEICYMNKLEDLRLYKNQVNDINPKIACLTDLKYFDLSSNKIEKIPVQIGSLTSLTTLSLSNNNIADFTQELTSLKNLKTLDLSNNKIISLPPQVSNMTALEVLTLDSNNITTLPDQITKLPNLNELNVSNNSLTSLPNDIGNTAKLQYINIQNNAALPAAEKDKLKNSKVVIISADEGLQNNNSNNNNPNVPQNMALIKAGTFTMGSPSSEVGRKGDETQHQVTFTYDFLMGKYEVTQKEYNSLMGNNPSNFKGDNLPVERVTWFDAIKYCNALSKKEDLPVAYNESTGDLLDANGRVTTDITKVKGYRLPTEAEWEYAVRAGSSTPFNTGNNLTTSQANYNGNYPYNGNSKGTYRQKTTEVGSFSPNAWGLYDMHGNLSEWCHDWKADYTGNVTNPIGVSSGSIRVLRGGSWINYAKYCRSAYRGNYNPTYRYNGIGFRIARSQ